jgi:pimeloyl-ACP methyl ester carboxylesterase
LPNPVLVRIGDSSSRHRLTYQESVAQDFKDIVSVLESQLGDVSIVLAGLCSGADNAIRLALDNPRVVEMVLLDPVCETDKGFRKRALGFRVREFAGKCTRYSSYARWLKRRIGALTNQSGGTDEEIDVLSLRDIPPPEQMRTAFESLDRRNGRVLSVFSEYALRYYNQIGQLGRVLEVEGYERFCTELFWPHALHTYPLESHRRQLIEAIKAWAAT